MKSLGAETDKSYKVPLKSKDSFNLNKKVFQTNTKAENDENEKKRLASKSSIQTDSE